MFSPLEQFDAIRLIYISVDLVFFPVFEISIFNIVIPFFLVILFFIIYLFLLKQIFTVYLIQFNVYLNLLLYLFLI